MLRLENRTCLISGASSGLGEHFARIIAAQGAQVVLGARRRERVAALAAELGDKAMAVAMDVTDEASVIAAFDAAEARFGPVDTVIANAGISTPGRAIEVSAADVRALFDTNLLGVFFTVREGARRMIAAGSRESGRGRIVVTGSITSEVMQPGLAAYCASKAGVAWLAQNLASEWVRQGVNVNVIQPGYILTEMAGDWFSSDSGKAQIATFPRRRLQPVELLDETVLHLCSDASLHTTGAIINIDDGQALGA